MERQSFGFKYQKEFCKKHNLKEEESYTSKYDTYYKNYPCQIKTYKNKNELMMADPFRYLNSEDDFILVVAQRNDKNEIIRERKVLIRNKTLQDFFYRENFKARTSYCKKLLETVSNDRKDDEYFKKSMKQEVAARKNSIINVQAKRDHKSQKRVQWAIPNRYIDKFLDMFEEI